MDALLKIFSTAFACLLFIAVAATSAWPADYVSGDAAYDDGDYEAAMAIWKPAAEAGNVKAQVAVADLYSRGLGTAVNLVAAAYWLERAALAGSAVAQYNLGNAYHGGHGVDADEAEAAKWWRMAAEQGLPNAMFNLANQYYLGKGVERDETLAVEWYQKAAAAGHEGAQQVFQVRQSNDWLKRQDPQHFTIQLAVMQDQEGIERYVARHGISGETGVYTRKLGEKTVSVLVLGAYPTREAAKAALAQLPADVRKQKPWIRTFAEIRAVAGE